VERSSRSAVAGRRTYETPAFTGIDNQQCLIINSPPAAFCKKI
jgi:hypothetical protein